MRAINATTTYAHAPSLQGSAPGMHEAPTSSICNEQSPFVFMAEVTRDCDVTARAVRKWLEKGHFPQIDGNLHGRNFWRRETYHCWQVEALAGRFAKPSNLLS
jgi:hypothetical protein